MGSLWRRMDATAMTGTLIRWPTHLDSYGGCGTSVYALWPRRTEEPMIVCAAGLDVHAVLTEEPVGPAPAWHQAFPDLDDDDTDVSSRSDCLIGHLLLGTTGATWALRDPAADPKAPMHEAFSGFWHATEEDLSGAGRQVIDALSASYGRRPVLLTVQDT
ncbi:MAG TPA: hypothetical protein VN520_13425 [Streptomyces sp.]|uniref:hypothetical protein n=1 Tax=Streptomyces sp. TaxID=1931 RepID=UPI002BC4F9E3|nr:hypothetical protein [Streptomyces sp.]HWU07357.1 hypothetical protein [Streptomyces sp.]